MLAVDLAKFDPDQPRDEHGRWTSGSLGDALPGAVVDLEGDPQLVGGISHGLTRMAEAFPQTAERLTLVATEIPMKGRAGWMEGFNEQALAGTEIISGQIVFNPAVHTDPEQVKADLERDERGAWLVRPASMESVALHEFGHLLSAHYPADRELVQGAPGLARPSWSHIPTYVPSGYARTSEEEYFAELVAQHYIDPDWRSSGPGALVGDWLDATSAAERGVQKFDETEPRDDRGRWTTGGTTYADETQLRNPTVTETWDRSSIPVPATWLNVKDALKDLRGRYDTNFSATLLRGDPARILPALAAYDYIAGRYPEVQVNSISLKAMSGKDTNNIAYSQLGPNGDRMVLNEAFFGVDRDSPWGKGPGWFVAGTDNPQGTVIHEFGHSVMGQLLRDHIDAENNVVPSAEMMAYQRASAATVGEVRALSGYAAQSGGNEVFADAFNAYANPDSRSQDNVLARAMGQMVVASHLDQPSVSVSGQPGIREPRAALAGWWPITAVTKAAGSPLTFADRARAVLARGYADAYAAGYDDTRDASVGDELDANEIDAAIDDAVEEAGDRLPALAVGLIGGIISARLFDSWLGGYAASIGGIYQRGFGAGVEALGEVTRATWRTQEDGITCPLCDERDGMEWYGDEPHPYPGEGYFGEQCKGGPHCRCVIEYDVVTDPGDLNELLADLPDYEAVAKFDESQPRDAHGRWASGEGPLPAGEDDDGFGPPGDPYWDRYLPKEPVAKAVGMWSGDRPTVRAIRELLKSQPSSDDLTSEETNLLVAGKALVQAVSDAEPVAPRLYRGINVGHEALEELAALKPGDKIDLNLSSWTTERSWAAFFAESPSAGAPVYFDMSPGGKALELAAHGASDGEHEWLTDGRFTVEVNDMFGDGAPGGTRGLNLTLTQDTVFASDELVGKKLEKFSESQPRDSHGRWTSGTEEMDAAARTAGVGIDDLVRQRFTDEAQRSIASAIGRIQAVFPGKLRGVNLFTTNQHEMNSKFGRGTMGAASPDGKTVLVSDMLGQTVAGGWIDVDRPTSYFYDQNGDHSWTAGGLTTEGTVLHEFTHSVLDGGLWAMHDEPWSAYVLANRLPPITAYARADEGAGHERAAELLTAALTGQDVPGAQDFLDAVKSGYRERVRKFDEAQPRDSYGRWTAGGSPNPDPIMHDRLEAWAERAYMYRQSLSDKTGEYSTHGWALVHADAEALLAAANEAPPTKYPLFRGIGFNLADMNGHPSGPQDYAKFRATMTPGAVIPMNLSSWTRDPGVARQFASNSFNTVSDSVGTTFAMDQVTFRVEPGAHALDATYDIPQGPDYSEHLMAGLFEVEGVEDKVVSIVDGLTLHTVSLRQVGLLDAAGVIGTKLEKYDEAQPRDERGRWTFGGGSLPEGLPEGHTAAWQEIVSEIHRDFPVGPGNKNGNCYPVAATLTLNRERLGLKNVKLIQATAMGQGPIAGKPFGHSWVEADGPEVAAGHTMRMAYDFANNKESVLPAVVYRYFGQVRDVHEYTPEEAMREMVKTENYGPWVPTGDDVL